MAEQPHFTTGLLRAALANWNQDPDLARFEDMAAVWKRVLGDLDPDACRKALNELVVRDGYFPRPIEIRKRVIDARPGGHRPPSAFEAWDTLQSARAEANTGRGGWIDATVSPVLSAVVQRIGPSWAGLHTNGDREYFTQVYDDELAKFNEKRYALARNDVS